MLFLFKYLDLLFTRDENHKITTKLYDKYDAFGFHIVNFPFMSSNIPSQRTCLFDASQLIRYALCCSNDSDDCQGFPHKLDPYFQSFRLTNVIVRPSHPVNRQEKPNKAIIIFVTDRAIGYHKL